MTSKTFAKGTVIDSAWLNDVNAATYTGLPAAQTQLNTNTTTIATLVSSVATNSAKLAKLVFATDYGVKADGTTDDTVALQAAFNYASSNGRSVVILPAGRIKTTATVYTRDTTIGSGTVACGVLGQGPFTTRFVPSGDFTVLNYVASYIECGGFSVEWPTTAIGSIPSTRVGVEFCDGYNQVSQTHIHDILVMYAYNSFLQRDWTGSPGGLGTMYVVDFERLVSFRAADYGLKFTAVSGGSTTHRFSTCWMNASDSTGVVGGKGFYFNGINDILMTNCAVDLCKDIALNVLNSYQVNVNGIALESCAMTTNGAAFMIFTGVAGVSLVGVKEIACSVSVGAGNKGYVIFAGANCKLNLINYVPAALTTTSGTLYRVGLNSATTRINVDSSIAFTDVQDNGWFSFVSFGGIRYSSTGGIPTQGTNQKGEYVRNMLPAVGSPKGWYCTVAGSPGTWVSEGNL